MRHVDLIFKVIKFVKDVYWVSFELLNSVADCLLPGTWLVCIQGDIILDIAYLIVRCKLSMKVLTGTHIYCLMTHLFTQPLLP